MKKIVFYIVELLLCFILVLGMAACNQSSQNDGSNTQSPSDSVAETTSPTPQIVTSAEIIASKTPETTATGTPIDSQKATQTPTSPTPSNTAAPTSSKSPSPSSATQAPEKITLKVLDVKMDSIFWSDGKLIAGKKNGKCGVINTNGKTIVPFEYDYMNCPSSDGYVVAYKTSSKVVDSQYVENFETIMTNTDITCDCYVFDSKGKVIYTTNYVIKKYDIDWMYYFEDEYILSCNDGMIVTSTPYDHEITKEAREAITIRKLDGTFVRKFDNVDFYTTYMDGKMVINYWDKDPYYYSGWVVLDKSGKVLAEKEGNRGYENDSLQWEKDGIIGGYFFAYEEDWSDCISLISADLKNSYRIQTDYLANVEHYGTIVASKVVTDSGVSDLYYLIDLAKCQVDADGLCIPTLSAALSTKGYDQIYISCEFGKGSNYALVEKNGAFGYLSMEGKREVMYQDAGRFTGGLAIVKDSSGIYVVNEKFEKQSNVLTGYDSVSTCGCGVYMLTKGDTRYIAVYNK